MGQKVPPLIQRVGYIKDWESKWTASKKNFPLYLEEDYHLRNFLEHKAYPFGSVAKVKIERDSGKSIRVKILTSRPGVVIGRRGKDIERVREYIEKLTNREVFIDVEEIKVPELDAKLVGDNIAFQISKRVPFRRAVKRTIQRARDEGCKGIKIRISGRLGGVELARTEIYKFGKIPLHTLRADIDYAIVRSQTTYGVIGVKVWIYNGEIIPGLVKPEQEHGHDAAQKDQGTDGGSDGE